MVDMEREVPGKTAESVWPVSYTHLGDHGAGVDLDDLAADIELGAFFDEDFGFFAQLVFTDGLRAFTGVEQGAGREFEAA